MFQTQDLIRIIPVHRPLLQSCPHTQRFTGSAHCPIMRTEAGQARCLGSEPCIATFQSCVTSESYLTFLVLGWPLNEMSVFPASASWGYCEHLMNYAQRGAARVSPWANVNDFCHRGNHYASVSADQSVSYHTPSHVLPEW